MKVHIAVIDVDPGADPRSTPFCVVWPIDNDVAQLSADLVRRASASVNGLPIVVLTVDARGAIRTYGTQERSIQAAKLILTNVAWRFLEIASPAHDPGAERIAVTS